MTALVDFGAMRHLPTGPVWRAYDGDGWLAPATTVAIGTDTSGAPLARLSLTRAALPGHAPDPFAMLDITVVCARDLDAALSDLRDSQPGTTLRAVVPDNCRIHLGDPLLSAPDGDRIDLLASGRARMIRQLGWDGGLALEAMLQAGENPLILSGAAAFPGISPRVGAVVGFDQGLLTALSERLPATAFTRSALETVLLAGLEALPISGTDGITGTFRTALCAALADRVFDTLTEPLGHDTHGIPLARLSKGGIAPVHWDMLTPYRTMRWLVLAAMDDDPLDRHLAQHGAAGIVTRSVLPVVPRSQHRLVAHVNFPATAPGVHALGVTAQAAPNPPQRPAAATASGILNPDHGTLPLMLKLAAGEPLSYTLSCFCVVETANGVQQFHGPQQQRHDQVLVLSPGDFGVRIHAISASAELLDIATLELTYSYQMDDETVTQVIPVTDTGAAVIVPLDASDGTMTLTATKHATARRLITDAMPLQSTTLSAHLFASYGPQTATIIMDVRDASTQAVEVMAGATGAADLQTIAFDMATEQRSYRYFAASPFAPGFRYRLMGAVEWTYHPDPQEPLSL